MSDPGSPYHAHIYYSSEQRAAADKLRQEFVEQKTSNTLFVGRMTDRAVGPHPIPQFEVHFVAASLPAVQSAIRESGLRALVHPLTDDDLADHTSLAQWIGDPIDLDLGTLDPPGRNQGVARFGKSDF